MSNTLQDVAIVSGVRTPFGRSIKGNLKDTRPDVMGALVIKESLARAKGIDGKEIDDVVMGCAMPEAEQGMNVARIAALTAGLPVEVPAVTVNRFCASGVQSVADVAARIASGSITTGIAGGLETMSMIPMGGNKVSLNRQLVETNPAVFTPMGVTAENIARRFEVSRKDQDEFALRSHQRASAAQKNGVFAAEIIPVVTKVYDAAGHVSSITVDKDEYPRADSTIEALAKLKPAFDQTGTVTAGNSSPLTDGAAAVVLTTAARAKSAGLAPLGWFRAFAVAGVPPEIMGIGPVPAIRKLLDKTGLKIDQIDLFELNEAFAAQALYCARELKIDPEKLNVNGGAIALGHPLGVSGTRLTITALNELNRRKGKYAIVSMCIGGGMGAAALLERAQHLMTAERPARAIPCAFVAALLVGITATFRILRAQARLGDHRDPIEMLEHPTGGMPELLHAAARVDAAHGLRIGLWWLPALALAVIVWKKRGAVRWRGAAIAFVLVGVGLLGWQAITDRRIAMRTLCWAAASGVYDRPTRERALDRGRALIGSPLGRVAEMLGAGANARCETAGQVLGIPAAK